MAKSNGSFQGKTALITGGSTGIGLALARLLAASGANVWLLARHADVLERAAASLPSMNGQRHGYIVGDVTNRDQVQAAVQKMKQQAGVPDVLINCAGAAHPAYIQDTPLEVFHDMMHLNYLGIVHMVKAWLPDLIERGSGYIVNFASMAGYMAVYGYAAYTPSKYAVRGFSDSLRLELKPLGIQVSVVFPPDTDTPGMVNENKTKPYETKEAFSSKLESPDDVAKRVLKAMARRQYVILPGFEAALYYRLMFLLGNAIYPVMDSILAGAVSKKKKLQEGSHGYIREGVRIPGRPGSDQERVVSVLHPDDRERGNRGGVSGSSADHVRVEQLPGSDNRSAGSPRGD
jgi:3-dehydrosphinganine reductase